MGYDLWSEESKARSDYANAYESYIMLQEKYLPSYAGADGKQIMGGTAPTSAVFKKIRDAIDRLTKALIKWQELSERMSEKK